MYVLILTDKCNQPLHRRSLSLQQMEAFTENHNWTQCREQWMVVRSPAPKTQLHHSSYIRGSGSIKEEGAERLQEPEHQKVCCKTASPRNGCVVRLEQRQCLWVFNLEGESFMMPLDKEPQATSSCWELRTYWHAPVTYILSPWDTFSMWLSRISSQTLTSSLAIIILEEARTHFLILSFLTTLSDLIQSLRSHIRCLLASLILYFHPRPASTLPCHCHHLDTQRHLSAYTQKTSELSILYQWQF